MVSDSVPWMFGESLATVCKMGVMVIGTRKINSSIL